MKVSDEQILGLLGELRARGERVSGERLRRELQARFGARGGVSRIYRLLAEAPRQATGADPAPASRVRQLEEELAQARARARLAEERDDAHQLKWAREVDALRQRVKELEPLQSEARRWQNEHGRLAIELQAARMRIQELERRQR